MQRNLVCHLDSPCLRLHSSLSCMIVMQKTWLCRLENTSLGIDPVWIAVYHLQHYDGSHCSCFYGQSHGYVPPLRTCFLPLCSASEMVQFSCFLPWSHTHTAIHLYGWPHRQAALWLLEKSENPCQHTFWFLPDSCDRLTWSVRRKQG